uniref:Homeobox domain-containing protein n=1 Tax=Sciurus vulgaris TaxID=55149 RepID=A0A8D2ANT2_SCIVU
MASKASSVEDSPKEEGERKHERGKRKPRHRFTKHDLEILNQSFEQNPYPEFATREELANQMHCYISVINNFFQNKRARLRPREKQKISATAQPSCPQQAPLGRAEDGSYDSVVAGSAIKSSFGLERQWDTGRGSSPSFRPVMYSHPTLSEQGFERATFSTEESQHSRPFTFKFFVQPHPPLTHTRTHTHIRAHTYS